MKKVIQITILFLILMFTIAFQKEISTFIILNFVYKKDIVIENPNQYKLNYNFQYLDETEKFFPNNKKELINVFYTVLNNGWDNFTFYCGQNYNDCINDIESISSDSDFLSILNNFIHPFNSYNIIYTNYNTLGKITVRIDKTYHEHEIELLKNKVDEIYNKLVKETMTPREKILVIHDYIVNNTTYDSKRAEAITSKDPNFVPVYQSHKAIGTLIQNMAICGGYSDAMSLFLIKMGIPNYKISNKDHIWNFVYVEGAWYHLDLTWDDPVLKNGDELLIHDYFLITTDKLFSIKNNHEFSQQVFIEAAQN